MQRGDQPEDTGQLHVSAKQRQKRKVKTDSVVRLLKTAWGTLKLTYGTAFILYSKYELGAK